MQYSFFVSQLDYLGILFFPRNNDLSRLLSGIVNDYHYDQFIKACNKTTSGELEIVPTGISAYFVDITKGTTSITYQFNDNLSDTEKLNLIIPTVNFMNLVNIWWKGYNYWKKTGKIPESGSINWY